MKLSLASFATLVALDVVSETMSEGTGPAKTFDWRGNVSELMR